MEKVYEIKNKDNNVRLKRIGNLDTNSFLMGFMKQASNKILNPSRVYRRKPFERKQDFIYRAIKDYEPKPIDINKIYLINPEINLFENGVDITGTKVTFTFDIAKYKGTYKKTFPLGTYNIRATGVESKYNKEAICINTNCLVIEE